MERVEWLETKWRLTTDGPVLIYTYMYTLGVSVLFGVAM
jgi:hypothetical protein